MSFCVEWSEIGISLFSHRYANKRILSAERTYSFILCYMALHVSGVLIKRVDHMGGKRCLKEYSEL